MREVEQKGAAAGLFGTVLVWILIFLFFYVGAFLFKPKEFKTIKIRLDAAQKIEKTESGKLKTENGKLETENARQSEQTARQSEQTAHQSEQTAHQSERTSPVIPSVAKESPKTASEKPKKEKAAPTKQTQPAKQTQPEKQTEPVLQKSIDELMAEQQTKKKSKKEFDWSQFDDIEGNTSSNSTALAKNTLPSSNQSELLGSAASSSQNNTSAKTSSNSNTKSAANQTASSSTTQALQGAVSAKAYSSSTNGVSSSVTANTGKSSDGKVSLQMTDGTPRTLLEPAEPKIILSKEAADSIDSTKHLTITFTVTKDGTVPVSSVKISPDILKSLVTMEIREQISRWRFQSAATSGQAQFSYTIKKQ